MPPTVSVSDHLTALRRLLHDPNDVYFSAVDKLAYVNEAVKRRDLDTGANRSLITYSLVTGQDVYTLDAIAAGTARIFDITSVFLVFTGSRIQLGQLPYSELTALYRQQQNWRSQPAAWAWYAGATSVYIGPPPSTTYSTEWDVSLYSATLAASDNDPLPYPFSLPVPYFAAHVAKMNERKYAEADEFLAQYLERIQVCLNARSGMVPTQYARSLRL